jgi:signal transduction histidine kinase
VRALTPRDVRIAGIVALIQIGGSLGANGHASRHGCWWGSSCHPATHLNALAVLLLALGPLALVFRRLHPRPVLAAIFGATLLYVALGYVQGANYASLAVAVVSVVFAGDRIAAITALAAGWLLFLWLPAALGNASAPSALAALAAAAWLIVLLAAAEAKRARYERVVQARRAREEHARRQADEERLRIARELHDVLAHSISLINVQSGVALHLIDEQPEQARTALTAINEASADALREVRSVLGVLRGSGEQPPRSPAAGLDRMEDLVSGARAAGVDVSVEVHGERRPLPASLDLAAFRIVQESLTNVVRHAAATTARVALTYGPQELTLEVLDDGHGSVASDRDGSGSGIAGMRERAAALGGELTADPQPGGGFRVRARLPLRGAR